MAESTQKETISWTASEFIDHQRGASWYMILLAGTAGLTAGVYFLSKDYFAMVVIVVLGIIVASVGHWRPRQIEYKITDQGFHVADKFYPYNQFKFFSIVHEGDLSSIVLEQTKRYLPPLTAFIDADDEGAIVEFVGEHLPLHQARPDRVDRLSQRLRF